MSSKESVTKGSILLRERPFIYVLSSKLRTNYCDYCFAKGDLLKCSNCQYVYYCDKACQREGWPLHRSECNNLKKVAPRIVPDAPRMMARLIRKLRKGGDAVRSYYTRDKFRMFKDLMSHYSDLKLDRCRMEHFTSICGVLFDFLSDTSLPNSAELMGVYGRMCINSFNICDSELKSIGTGMYLAASVIDHSCEPNAIATFEGTTLIIRALNDMPFVDWTKIFISYVDVLNTTKARQDELQMTYYFLCKCPKCLDESILNVVSGAACPNCEACVDMRDLNNTVCSKCAMNLDEKFVNEYREVMELSEMHLQNMKALAYLDVCKVCLKRQHKVLYKLNINHIKILDLAFESSIDLGQWQDAVKFGVELIDGYLFYYDGTNPLLGLLYLKLGKIFVYLGNFKPALKYLQSARDILKVTHGTSSRIFTEEIDPLLQQVSLQNGF